jgi:thiamine pyrophosphate-dependent acetolactate synthase large subunit-like protein
MAAQPSFDVTSTVDLQEVDNAVNQAKKEIAQRYDFKGSKSSIEFKKSENEIELVSDSDLVVAVGTELAPSDLWYGPLQAEGKLIRIDIDPTGVSTNAQPTVALVGDCAETLRALNSRLEGLHGDRGGRERAAAWRSRLRADAEREGARYVTLCASLDKALDDDAILAGDSAMACYYGALSNLPLHRPRSFLYPTGVGTLGYGLPAAIGAKVGAPAATSCGERKEGTAAWRHRRILGIARERSTAVAPRRNRKRRNDRTAEARSCDPSAAGSRSSSKTPRGH